MIGGDQGGVGRPNGSANDEIVRADWRSLLLQMGPDFRVMPGSFGTKGKGWIGSKEAFDPLGELYTSRTPPSSVKKLGTDEFRIAKIP